MIHVKIVTPSGLYHTFEASKIHACTAYGECTLLPNHMPIVAMLEISKLTLTVDENEKDFAISSGILHLNDNQAYDVLFHPVNLELYQRKNQYLPHRY